MIGVILTFLFVSSCGNQGSGTREGNQATLLIGIGTTLSSPSITGTPADLANVASITLTISAPDMAAITTLLPLNGTNLAINVPAGVKRVVNATARDAGGNVTHTGSATVAQLVAGSTLHLSITLNPLGPGDLTPPIFSGLTVAVPSSPTTVALAWNPATDNMTGSGNILYDISLSTISGAPFNVTATSPAGATSYTVSGLIQGTNYYIIVRARDQGGNRDSNLVEAHVLTPVPNILLNNNISYNLQGTPTNGVLGGISFSYYDNNCGNYTLNFGDGTSDFRSCPRDGGTVNVNHIFLNPGTYTVDLSLGIQLVQTLILTIK